MPLKVLTPDGQVQRPDLGQFDPVNAFVEELGQVAEALRTGNTPQKLSAALARDAVVLCHREAESVRCGQPVTIDPL